MKLFKSGELEFAYDTSFEEASWRVNAEHPSVVIVRQDGSSTSMGWPNVRLVGRLGDVARCVRTCWESGDDATDIEVLAYAILEGEEFDALDF